MRDLRRYASQTSFGVIAGFVGALLTLGLGMIFAIYGGPAALGGLACLLAVLIPAGVIWALLQAIERLAKKLSDE